MLEELTTLIKAVAQGAADDAMVTRGSAWITQLKKEFPGVHMIIMAMLYKSPEAVLDALGKLNAEIAPYTRNPHAIAYIRALQVKLRGTGEGRRSL